MKGDLHVHTSISDSSFTTEETLKMAKENNVTHIGIVNHDTVRGLKDAIKMGEKLGIRLIPGIEISAYDYKNNRKVHMLGYNFDLEGKHIKEICTPLLKRRNENSKWQIRKIIEAGYDLDIKFIREKSEDSNIIYKQHIMQALIEKNYTDKIYSDLYQKLFKNNGICAKDIEYIDVFEALKAIKKDNGVAVLAHPGQLNSYEIIPELVKEGLDGIELNHHAHKEEDRIKIKKYAEEFGLFLTGGTDFHGDYGSVELKIGDIECPKETLKLL